MLKTLALKELRETAGIAVLALVLFANYVVHGMGVSLLPWATSAQRSWIPFVDDPLLTPFGLIAALLAIALGFRQTVWESAFGTDQFLLHRPLSRGELIGVKLLVGAAVLVVSSALPTLVYAWWAATPGTHASPFEWSMTAPFWRIPAVMTTVYLGSFLSGIRPARWVGTRLVPLAGVGLLAFLLMMLPYGWIYGWIWWLVPVVMLDVLLVVSIFFVVRTRDY